jgi:hypothetical protein
MNICKCKLRVISKTGIQFIVTKLPLDQLFGDKGFLELKDYDKIKEIESIKYVEKIKFEHWIFD